MAIDEKERQVILECFSTVSQARLHCNDAIVELVKQTIRLREEDTKLENAQMKLRILLKGENSP
jgi:hypothetical protein